MGDEELCIEIERSVFDTSKDIQIKVMDWLRREIKTVTGIYYKGRQELIWGLGRWEGTRSIRIIENDLNILEYELAKVKYRKLADLRENIRLYGLRQGGIQWCVKLIGSSEVADSRGVGE